MRVFILLAACYAAVSAVPFNSQRIVGGEVTTIDKYPSMVVILQGWDTVNFYQICGGTILNQRSVLTAAHCFDPPTVSWYRARVGSTFAHSGGTLHVVGSFLFHPDYNYFDHDIALMRTASPIVYSNVVQPAPIAGANYFLGDNEVTWATGWGTIYLMGPRSEELRHVQFWTINQTICRERYRGTLGDNFLCVGWLDVGGRDQCHGDSGGPVYHHGVVVGVSHGGTGCASPLYPGLNMRVTHYSNWIQANA
ncbi:trypsin, alkaline C-like [Anticarsia gemmatalis]|uniref:trypsin, alkaline C-like n=1 Tax=Anticarsia gemmatalis TaxID=129554 RepID=UPI003F75E828